MRHSLAVICCVFITSVAAQSDRGTITGTISDPAGAVVPNAQILAKNVGTGAVYTTQSTATGNYTLVQLQAGTYEVTTSVAGFKKYVRSGITVQVATTLRIDIGLEVGSASESVTVSADASLLKTENGELSHNITTSAIDSLPILGIGSGQAGSAGIRNPNAVLLLIPGTYYSANAEVRVNGAPDNTQGYRIEGIDASNSGTPGVPAQSQPSVDAIQEITIQTSNYAAEYGLVGGGMFNLTMKSGTNDFHGTGYDYFVNEALNAGAPFFTNDARGNPRLRQRRNDYGFTVGGPVRIPKVYDGRDKTFFFFNFEQFRETATNSSTQTVPTAAYRMGDFSAAILSTAKTIGTDPAGRTMLEGMIYDPNTSHTAPNGTIYRDPFVGNQILPARFDPVAAKIQALFPSPVGPNASSQVNNYIVSFPSGRVTTVPSVKGDQTIGSKGRLSFFWERNRTANVPAGPPFGQNDGLPDPITVSLGTFTNTTVERINYDHALSPTMVLHLGAGYQQVDFDVPNVTSQGMLPNYNAAQELGLHGATVNQAFPAMSGFLAGNGTGGMKAIGGSGDTHNFTRRPSFIASATWVKGNHTMKAGSELQIHGFPAVSNSGTAGTYTFSQATTGQPFQVTNVNGANVGFGYASFLLGQVSSVGLSNPVYPRLGKHQLGIYVQDSWKITRRFTLDYGLRYDYSTYLREQFGRAPFFSATAMNPKAGVLGGTIYDGFGPGRCNCDVAHNYPWALGPRLGAAYQVNAKTVVRVGFGIVYNGTDSNNNASSGLAGASVTQASPNFGFPITTLAVGIPASVRPPAWPTYDPAQYPTGFPTPGASAPLVDQNAGRPGRQFQWSAGVQREFSKDLVFEASYVANRGAWWNSPGLLNINALTPALLAQYGLDINNPADQTILTATLNSAAAGRFRNQVPFAGFPLGQTVAQSLRPYPQFTTVSTYWDPLGKTWYDALQAKVTKRFSHGLSLISTFTWSKTLQLGAERDPNPGSSGNAVFNDVFNRGNNKYLSIYDQPFQFNLSANYTTPRLHAGGTGKILAWLGSDWTYGVFVKYGSGFPLLVPTASNASPALNALLFQSTFANRVPGQPLFLKDLNCHCFDPQQALVLNPNAWVEPAAGQWGTSAAYYDDYRKQRRPAENMNFGRTFRFSEKVNLNVRAEFTNVFNRSVVNDPSSANIKAQITTNQFGNYTTGFGSINATTSVTGAGTAAIVNIAPRSGTLVARLTF